MFLERIIGAITMKKKECTILCLILIIIMLPGCIQRYKEGEPDVISSIKMNQDEIMIVTANRNKIENKVTFAALLIQKYKSNTYHSIKFSTDYGYATSLKFNVYLWENQIKGHDPEMIVEYKPIDGESKYDIVHDSEKYQMYIDGELAKLP